MAHSLSHLTYLYVAMVSDMTLGSKNFGTYSWKKKI